MEDGCQQSMWYEADESGPCGKPTVPGTRYCEAHLADARLEARFAYDVALTSLNAAIARLKDTGLEP